MEFAALSHDYCIPQGLDVNDIIRLFVASNPHELLPRDMVYYAVKRLRAFLRNAVQIRSVCNTYKPAPATNSTRCHCVNVPSSGTFASQYLTQEDKRQTRPNAEVKL